MMNHKEQTISFLTDHNKVALIWNDDQITYRQLIDSAIAYAALLPDSPQARIAILAENRPEWIAAFYACWYKRLIPVPIDCMSSADEIAHIINDCQPTIVFCSASKADVLRVALEAVTIQHPALHMFADAATPLYGPASAHTFPAPNHTDTAVIIYTSGTTGSAKGVMLSFDNLLANIEPITSKQLDIYHSTDRLLSLLPFHHILPLQGNLIVPLYIGATTVLCPTTIPADIMALMQRWRITIFIGVPKLYDLFRQGIRAKIFAHAFSRTLFALAKRIHKRAFSRIIFKKVQNAFGGAICFLVTGGAKLDTEILSDFQTLGFDMLEGYGMTETAPIISFTRPGDGRPGIAGKPMDGVEVRIVDDEITVRGRLVMQGYYGRPAETQAIIRDGWLYTGDTGTLDSQGYLTITGRKKEIIVLASGKNINPDEVEQKIAASSDTIREVGVLASNDALHAIIFPNFETLLGRGIVNIDAFFKWEVIDRYNRSASPSKKILTFTIANQALPRTRLGKIKRFMLPDLVQKKVFNTENEPNFEEYTLIRAFLQRVKNKAVSATDHLEIDIGLDSLDKITFLVFLNDTFGINFNEQILSQHLSVEALAQAVRDKKTKIDLHQHDWSDVLAESVTFSIPRPTMLFRSLRQFGKGLCNMLFRIHTSGQENLPPAPFIIAANHQSVLDGLFIAVSLKSKIMKQSYFFAKEKHVKQGLVRFLADRSNIISIDIQRDLKATLQKMAAVLRSGHNVIIFPEGARSRDGHLSEFKKTFAILSRELTVPIVPAVICGTFHAWPVDKKLPRFFSRIQIAFQPAIYPIEESYEHLSDRVQQTIASHLLECEQ